MDSAIVREFARTVLHLEVHDADAVVVADSIERLRAFVRTIETVPLGYLDDAPLTPRDGDTWLDTWPSGDR